jgi:DNA modification methylase
VTAPVIIGPATLYLADCTEVLPALPRVDLVCTDPPYGIGFDKAVDRKQGKNGWKHHGPATDWDREPPPPELFGSLFKAGEHQLIWGGNYFTDRLPPTMQWLVWDKMQRDFSLADCEFAWSSQRKASRVFSYSRARANQDSDRVHPTQKPIELMRWCLQQFPDAKSVLDPFMGSGTTGIAAVEMGRTFIGIERDERYFEAAVKRIDAAWRQTSLFAA